MISQTKQQLVFQLHVLINFITVVMSKYPQKFLKRQKTTKKHLCIPQAQKTSPNFHSYFNFFIHSSFCNLQHQKTTKSRQYHQPAQNEQSKANIFVLFRVEILHPQKSVQHSTAYRESISIFLPATLWHFSEESVNSFPF